MKAAFTLRPARPRDARAMAQILARWVTATDWFEASRPASSSPAAMRMLIVQGQVWLAVGRGIWPKVLGFVAIEGDEIAALYVDGAAQGMGIGRGLLNQARRAAPRPLRLATFQANQQALGFYRAMGCEEKARTAGENEEGLPDIRLICPTLEPSAAI